GHDAVEPDHEQPDRQRVGQVAHPSPPSRTTASSSTNSVKIRTNAAATSSAEAMFSTGIVPPEASVPAVPSGRKLCRKAPPSSIAATPVTAYPPAPVPLTKSTAGVGVRRRKAW